MNNLPERSDERILSRLSEIYRKFSRSRRIDNDSRMCLFWVDPTVEILIGSDELTTIETEFGIVFDEDSAMELYDMTLEEAAHLIAGMIADQNGGRYDPCKFITSIVPDRAKDILLHLWKNREDLRPAIMLAKAEIEFDDER
jgi:hypothetical protein